MDFLLKITYYGVTAIATLLLCIFFLGNLFTERGGSTEKLILLVSGLTGTGFVVWSMIVGHGNGNWAMGIGLSVLGPVLFGLLMLIGLFSFTNIHWQ